MSLATIIAGDDVRWASYPALSMLRQQLLNAMIADPGVYTHTQLGDAVKALGQRTEVYNLCDGLHKEARTGAPPAPERSVWVMAHSLGALGLPVYASELRALGLQDLHLAYLDENLTAPSPLYLLSTAATLVTLSAICLAAA